MEAGTNAEHRTDGPVIDTERFLLRPLTVDDVTDRYLGWFTTPAAGNILSAASMRTLDDLKMFIAERSGRDDVLFLGIFERGSNRHIGNLKYEPVDPEAGDAVVGIFIGEADFRGKGVGGEVMKASAAWLKAHRNIRHIVLGVETSNVAAFRAYQKAGFEAGETPRIPTIPGVVKMICRL